MTAAPTSLNLLDDNAIDDALASLPHWRYDAQIRSLSRSIVFVDFSQALAAMVRIGIEAEKANHHPEWSNVYNKLDIRLTTHDVNGVSFKDLALGREIDAIVATFRGLQEV
jgi:4a-hydroxytetrahydrobiopterin dehydratase